MEISLLEKNRIEAVGRKVVRDALKNERLANTFRKI